MSDFVSFY